MKKYKFLFLIILVVTFFSSAPLVKAVTGMPNHNGTLFLTPPTAVFADNTNNQLTPITTIFSNTEKAYLTNTQVTLTGANDYGAAIVFDALQPFVAGYTYTVSILINLDPLLTDVYPKFSTSGTRVCVAENLSNTITRYNLSSNFPCSTAQMYYIAGTSPSYNTVDSPNDTSSRQYGLLTYIFTPDFTGTSVVFNFQSSARITNPIAFGGYVMEVLSDNKTGVSAGQVQSIIDNSGLASADSVEEVQQEINNVKQDINNASNAIVDSNKETQDVIKNQTEEQIKSQEVCNYIDKNNVILIDKVLSSSGSIAHSTYGGITDYIKVTKTDKLQIKKEGTWGSLSTCFYNVNKDLISCTPNVSLSLNQYLTIPNEASYARFSIQLNTNQPQFELCKQGNQALNDNLNDLNNNITNSNTDESQNQANSFFEGFKSDDYGLSDIITMPLDLIKGLTNNTCVALNLTIPFVNKNFQLPCMSSIYQQYFGDFFNLYQTITFGFVAYWVIVKIFALVKGFKDPNNDKVEVMDL